MLLEQSGPAFHTALPVGRPPPVLFLTLPAFPQVHMPNLFLNTTRISDGYCPGTLDPRERRPAPDGLPPIRMQPYQYPIERRARRTQSLSRTHDRDMLPRNDGQYQHLGNRCPDQTALRERELFAHYSAPASKW